MDWQGTPFTLPLLAAAAVSVALAMYTWRRRSAPGVVPFIGLMLAVTLWSVGYALELLGADLATKLVWARVQYLGITSVPVAWLIFALQYTSRSHWLTHRRLFLMAIVPLLVLALVWTNDVHHLIWRSTELDPRGSFSILVVTYGPMFWVFAAYTYLLLLFGSFLLLQALFYAPGLVRRQCIAVLVAVLAPWAGNLLYVSGLSPFGHLDLTPFAFTLSGLAITWGLFRLRLLDIVPVARDAVLESMGDAVIVLDGQGRIVDLNPAAVTLVGRTAAQLIGQPADQALLAFPILAQRCLEAAEAQEEITLGQGQAQRTFDLSISPLRGRHSRLTGRLVVLRDITALRQADRTLRESEQKYRALVEQSLQGIVIAQDIPPRLVFANATLGDMLGYTAEELLSLSPDSIQALVHPEDRATFFQRYQDRLAGKPAPSRYEFRAGCKDGSFRWLEMSASRIEYAGQVAVQATFVDITKRRQAELTIRESEARYRAIVEAFDGLIYICSPDYRIEFMNQQLIERTGCDATGALCYQALHELETICPWCVNEQVFQGETVHWEVQSPKDNHWYYVVNTPIYHSDGSLSKQAMILDITERKQAEAELRRLKEFHEGIVESMAEGIVMQDIEGYLTFANPAAAELLGYSVEELTGQYWTAIVPLDQQPIVRRADERRMRGESDRYELELVRRDGARLAILISGSPRFDPDTGDFAGTLVVFADISEQKQAEEELRQSEERYRSLYSMVRLMCDNVPDLIWAKDLEKRYLFANEAVCRKLLNARDTEEPLGKTDMFFAERERNAYPENLEWHTFGEICTDSDAVVMSSRQPRRFDEFGNVQGEFMFLDVYKAPFWNKVGEMIGTVGCGRIVTREKEIETQREEAREAVRRRTEQLEALRQVGLEISAQLDLHTLLHSIVSRAVDLLDAAIGGLYLYRPAEGQLQVVADVGLRSSLVGTVLEPGEGLAGKIWQTGAPHIVDDYQHWEGRATIFGTQVFRATVGVPVRWGDEFLGVLDVSADAPGVFSASDAELLSLFATQAAIAIQNARLHEAEREQRELAEVLHEAAQAVGASLDLNEILRLILDQLKRVLVYSTASVLVLRNGDVPDLMVGIGYADERLTGREAGKLLANSPILRQMACDLQPVLSADVRHLEGWIWVIGAEHVRSWLGIPLVIHERMIGALMVDHSEPGAFGQQEMRVTQALARHAAQAIENARLYDEVQRRNRELAMLNRVIAVSAASLEIEPILETVCRELAGTFDSPHSAAALLNAEKAEISVIVEYRADGRASVLGQAIAVADVPLAEFLLQHKAPLVVDDARVDPRLGHICNLISSNDPLPLLIVPLLIEGEVVGGLGVAAVRPRSLAKPPGQAFSPGEVGLAYRVAEQVSGALARARLDEERRLLEEQFRQAQKMEALGRLAGGVAHDFNNLLTVIQISTQMLQHKLHLEDPLLEHVQRIWETGERAARLTRQLLSFSRREMIEPRVLNLNRVVDDLSQMLQRILGEDVRLITTLDAALWPVQAAPSQIDQVILNLVVNARDAMPEGGSLTIETANVVLDESYAALHVDARPGKHVMLSVSDTGAGMDDEIKDLIFEPFFTTKKRGEGTGLGLATVFGIVKQNRGHIEVRSRAGKGTIFKIYLPEAKAEAEAQAEGPTLPSTSALPLTSASTVLLVEDDAQVRGLVVRVLRSFGYRMLVAGDGLQALQIGAQHDGPIHLLLTDVIMPQMHGRELAEQLRVSRPEMRVLYMSGYTDEAIGQHGVLAPGVVFLPKPFTIEDLTQRVSEVLDIDASTAD